MRSFLRPVLLTLTIAALTPTPARAERVFEKGDLNLNVGALIQGTLRLTTEAGPADTDGKKGMLIDPFIRRARILTFGNLTKTISFFAETEVANLGYKADWAAPLYLLDAYISYAPVTDFNLDVGIILTPMSHHGIQGATSLVALDYHLTALRYPAGKTLRDAGIQARGFLADKLIHYRVAILNGVQATANAATDPAGTEPLNKSDIPRFAGQVRVNLMGSETAFFLQGLAFAKEPLLSVGVSADAQPNAFREGLGTATYLAVAGDVYCDYPLDENNEIVAQLGVYNYSKGDNKITKKGDSGLAAFGELGYRMDSLEPVISAEWFRPTDLGSKQEMKWRVGVNYFIEKHRASVKAEAGQDRVGEGKGTVSQVVANVQAQLYF